MIWDKILGHDDQVEMFRRSLQRNRLSHAYLFAGPAGVGKKLFARTMAQCLFCEQFSEQDLQACGQCRSCLQFLAEIHPDFYSIERRAGKSELTIDLFLGEKERRGKEGLCFELSLKPAAGFRKIAIIDDADLMNTASANALLKTLEEPPNNTLLILVVSNPSAVLTTIRSRCQIIRFAPLSTSDLSQLLIELQWTENATHAAAVAALSDGSLSIAEQLLEPILGSLRQTLNEHLSAHPFNSLTVTSQMLAGLDELGGDSAARRLNAAWIVKFSVEFFRQVLLSLSGSTRSRSTPEIDRFVQRYDAENVEHVEMVMELIQRVALAESHVEWKMAIPLCFEGLFDDLGRIMRSLELPKVQTS